MNGGEPGALERAEKVIERAWSCLPAAHKRLLVEVGASQWRVVAGPLGRVADDFLRSAGAPSWPAAEREEVDHAFGVWIPELRIVLVRCDHPNLTGVDPRTWEQFLARVAWHEWGHALSMGRCSTEQVAMGRRLIELAPLGIRERIRRARYRRSELTHELVADTYVLLMLRRLRGERGRPSWLHDEIHELLKELIGPI